MTIPNRPPFTRETALAKVRAAEDAWNSRDPVHVSLAYSTDSIWRNRDQFLSGRARIQEFLAGKWRRELDYQLVKDLWPSATAHRGALPVRMAQRVRPVVPQLRQRALGIRRRRLDASAGSQHQRRCYRRKRPQVLLARSRSSTGRPPRHP